MAEIRLGEELQNLSKDNFVIELKILELQLKEIEKKKNEPEVNVELLENQEKLILADKEKILNNLNKINSLNSDEYSYKAMDEAIAYVDKKVENFTYVSENVLKSLDFTVVANDANLSGLGFENFLAGSQFRQLEVDDKILDLLINCTKKVKVSNMAKVRAYGLQEVFGLEANKLANPESKAFKVIGQISQEEYEKTVLEEIKKFTENKYAKAEKVNQIKEKAQKVIKILKVPTTAVAALGGYALTKALNMDDIGGLMTATSGTFGVAVFVNIIEKLVSPKTPEDVKIAVAEKYLNDVLKALGYKENEINKEVEPEK